MADTKSILVVLIASLSTSEEDMQEVARGKCTSHCVRLATHR